MLTWVPAVLAMQACASAPGPEDDPFVDHMYMHFSTVGSVQSAIIRGDAGDAREYARRLADHDEPEGIPDSASGLLEAMRMQALRVADSPDLLAAAMATGGLGASCGSCHHALDGGPRFAVPEVQDEAGLATMERHVRGADRLWEGLIGPSDDSWREGARLLGAGTIPDRFLEGIPGAETRAMDLEALAGEAARTTEPAQRATVYGRILATCSGCHASR
jgi:cytochrome c553